MSRWLALCLVVLTLAVAGPALAQVLSERPDRIALTLYQDPNFDADSYWGQSGLTLVTEWRTIELPAGESVIKFRGVAESMVPQTAALDGLPAQLVERNQDYDLLSPGSLIAGSVGATVRRIRTNPVTGEVTEDVAILRSGPQGVMLEIDGRYEALGCSGGPERLVFDKIPPNLADKPTLSIRIRAKKAGTYTVRLTYLALGLSWEADYVARRNRDGSFGLTGWITLSNATGSSFVDAPTAVIAGDPERSYETRAPIPRVQGRSAQCWPFPTGDYESDGRYPPPPPPPPPPPAPPPPPVMAPADVAEMVVTAQKAEQSDIGDYKMYTLPNLTTVAARQTKQVLMLDQPSVKLRPVYRFTLDVGSDYAADSQSDTQIVLRTDNKKENGLGLPLPGGDLIVTEVADNGAVIIAAETDFLNNAIGSPVDLKLSQSGTVRVYPVTVSSKRSGKTRLVRQFEIRLVNTGRSPAEAEVFAPQTYGYSVRFSGRPKPVAKPGGQAWTMVLAPGEERTLRFTATLTSLF